MKKTKQFNLTFFLTALFFLFYPLIFWPFSYPFFSFKYPVFLFLTFSLALIWLLNWKKRGFQKVNSASLFFLLPLFFFLLLSLTFSLNFKTAFLGETLRYEGFLALTCYFFLFLFFSSPLPGGFFLKLKNFFLLGVLLTSLIALFEHFFFNPVLYLLTQGAVSKPTGRSFSTFANPTSFSSYLALLLPLAFYFASEEVRKKNYLSFSLLALGAGFLALLFTYSRSAWLGFLLALLLFAFLNARLFSPERGEKSKTPFSFALYCLLALIFLLVYFLPAPHSFRLSERLKQITEAEAGTSGGNRLLMWEKSLMMVKKYPLFGSGPDTLKLSFPREADTPWGKNSRRPLLDKAHNELIQLASTQGLPYLLFYLSFLFYLFLSSFRFLSSDASREEKNLVIALLSSLFSYLISLQFLFSHYSYAPFFWILAGILFGLANKGRERTIRLKSYLFSAGFLATLTGYLFLCFFWLGNIYYYRGEVSLKAHPLQAYQNYQKATVFSPWEELNWLGRAKAASQLAQMSGGKIWQSEVDKSLEIALKINPRDEFLNLQAASIYLSLAQAFSERELAYRSWKLVEKSYQINPFSALVWLEKGNVYATLAELERKPSYYRPALNSYLEAVRLGEKTATAYYNLGWVYEKLGEKQKAVSAYRKVLILDASYPEASERLKKLTENL